MAGTLLGRNRENNRIVLGLLEALERDSAQSQRNLAAQLGIAVGLVNIYLKRCAKKGLLKMTQAPPRRYAYYLTPHGFTEKARLTIEYLSHSFDLFRRAKADCQNAFVAASVQGIDRVVLAGVSELAEIAVMCALETGIKIVAIVDPRSNLDTFVGIPVLRGYDGVEAGAQGVVVTDLKMTSEVYAEAVTRFGAVRVLVPSLLDVDTLSVKQQRHE